MSRPHTLAERGADKRYTGKEWVGAHDELSVGECMTAIEEDE